MAMPLRGRAMPFHPPAFSDMDETEGPDITPLVDIIFLLLIFFIVAAAFAVRGMDVDLPPARSSRPLSGRILELHLAGDGSVSCDGKALALEDLGAFLRYRTETDRLAGMRQERNLVLRAAPDAPVAALVRIVDIVRSMGGEKLVIATGRQGGPKGGNDEANRRRGLQ